MRRADAGTVPQRRDVGIGPPFLALPDQPCRHGLAQAVDLPEAEAQGDLALALFQRAVPVGQIDVGGQHRDAMLARIAHDLRRGVEAHRLRIEQRAGEGRRVMALHPARHIDEVSKTGGVTFGEAVFAEALDLLEAPCGEFGIVAAFDHAADHHVLMLVHHAAAAEGRHGLAQPVRLLRAELRRVDGDLHRLFLENRDAIGPLQDRRKLVGRAVLGRRRRQVEIGLARACPAALLEIGVNHIALDRPGPHDGDLHHEIVEFARPEPRKHVHLRPAFDLEHAERVARAQHVVDRRILARDGRELVALAMMIFEQFQTLADAS